MDLPWAGRRRSRTPSRGPIELQEWHGLTGPAGSDSLRSLTMTCEELPTELRSSPTDLARFVEAVAGRELPYMLVPVAALMGWQERDPGAWRKVAAWLRPPRRSA